MTAETKPCNRRRMSVLIREAASRAVVEEDVWAKHKIHKLPAERIIRHMYHPETHQWSTDETIVKMEPEPFTHGAMRFCYRLKKMATPPKSATNHRFHSYGWTRASNYVAKCYHKGGEVDTSDEAKQAVQNDILLQYEAAHWAEKFNQNNPPKPIVFIRAYAIEFPDREGQPLFAVERFIAGTDSYGVGFVKHNTNSGFVDVDLHRITPQVFSAYSFYASRGTRLVADIQGVGDLYTDPQVLSIDYRFGDGDLGPRGMALFFHTFRHCHFSDSMGIPIFPLSRNELKNQAKYDEDEVTVSDDGSTFSDERKLDKFARIDLNRQSRRQSLMIPPMKLALGGSQEKVPTARRSNVFKTSAEVSHSIRQSMKMSIGKAKLSRSSSDVSEVMSCLRLATTNPVYDHRAFHRKASGEVRERHMKDMSSLTSSESHKHKRRSSMMNTVADVIMPTEETKESLGKVHYHLACLHGLGRFPDDVPDIPEQVSQMEEPHDVFSVLFHLCHAASLYNVAACLALARVKAGLDTTVSGLLRTVVPVDFEGAKDILRRAMESPQGPAEAKVTAGAFLFQILHDEGTASNLTMMGVLEDALNLKEQAEKEAEDIARHKERQARGGGFHVGDNVEANYAMEGTYYPGVLLEVSSHGQSLSVKYDDDGSIEVLSFEHVRHLVPPNVSVFAGETACALSDCEALGFDNADEKCILETYVMKAELAELKAAAGDTVRAAELFEEAADGAMNDGKMQSASKWSNRASELQG